MANEQGEPIHGEVSGNLTTATVFVLYPSGSTTARALAANEYLHITDILASNEDGSNATQMQILAITDAAGKVLFDAKLAVNGSINQQFATPAVCPKGVTPYGKSTSATTTSILIQGYISGA